MFVTYRRSSEISISLKRTFELALMTEMYPMSKIDVFVQVLQSDGGNEPFSTASLSLAYLFQQQSSVY